MIRSKQCNGPKIRDIRLKKMRKRKRDRAIRTNTEQIIPNSKAIEESIQGSISFNGVKCLEGRESSDGVGLCLPGVFSVRELDSGVKCLEGRESSDGVR